jgi:type I restriction enzyme, S subunit
MVGRRARTLENDSCKMPIPKMDRAVRTFDEVVTCFRDGTVTLRKNRRMSGFTEALKEIGYQGIRKGDLIIHAMDAFAGAIGVSDSDGKGTPVYLVCAPILDANPHFYAYCTREMARSQWIQALAKGIRERSTDFRFDDFGLQLLPLPPVSEQAVIVRFLDHANRLIRRYLRAKQKLIALLEEQKQSIIYHAVSRGLNSDVCLNPSGVEWLGDVPKHWQIRQLGHFSRIGNGSTPSRANVTYWSGGHYPWLNSSSVNRSPISVADQFVTDTALKECHLPIVKEGSLLIAITGQGKTRGTSAILGMEATINQHIAFVTPRPNFVLPDFLHSTLIAAYTELRRISDDSGSTKGALTCYDMSHFKIPLPPIKEQQQIVSYILEKTQTVRGTISRADSEVTLLREYRTRLISDVITGKLDVREAAARLPREVVAPERLEQADGSPDADDLASGELAAASVEAAE